MRVAVTGSGGHIGRAIVAELWSHGYQVVIGDRQPPADLPAPYRQVDLEDLGQAVSLLHGCDAVVHAATIPRPGGIPPTTFCFAPTCWHSSTCWRLVVCSTCARTRQ